MRKSLGLSGSCIELVLGKLFMKRLKDYHQSALCRYACQYEPRHDAIEAMKLTNNDDQTHQDST